MKTEMRAVVNPMMTWAEQDTGIPLPETDYFLRLI
jgi:hypothetical protein